MHAFLEIVCFALQFDFVIVLLESKIIDEYSIQLVGIKCDELHNQSSEGISCLSAEKG